MKDDKLFPEYDIIAPLGEGASANVYKVRHSEFGYIRAIRVLGETIISSRDPKHIKFLEECKILLRLGNGSHKNIVGITQPRLSNGKALVEMDYIEGVDLDEYIKESCKGFVPAKECQRLFVDLASALAYCHYDIFKFSIYKDEDLCVNDDEDGNFSVNPECEKKLVEKYKVIHNDIHSKNVRRKYDGSYVLLDFGLAIKNDTVIKSSTRKGGASEYKSPEKWSDKKDVDIASLTEQSDIYSFGVLMYEALAGNVPFPISRSKNDTEAEYELMNHHRHSIPEPIEPKRRMAYEKKTNAPWQKDYPDWMDDVIMKCLEKKPENRYRNGKELFEVIQKYLADQNNETDEQVVSLNERIFTLVNSKEELSRDKDVLINEIKAKEEQLKITLGRVTEANDKIDRQGSAIKEKDSRLKEVENTQKSQLRKIENLEKTNQHLLQSKRNNYSLKAFVLGVAVVLAAGFGGYTIGNHQSKKEVAIAEKPDSVHIYGSEYHLVYFYNKPMLSTKRNAYITTTEVLPVLKDTLDFVYIEFTNTKGQTSKGWINKKEAELKPDAEIIQELEANAVTYSNTGFIIKSIKEYQKAQKIDYKEYRQYLIDSISSYGNYLKNNYLESLERLRASDIPECDSSCIVYYKKILRVSDDAVIEGKLKNCADTK